jgi:acetyl esterase/lipase
MRETPNARPGRETVTPGYRSAQEHDSTPAADPDAESGGTFRAKRDEELGGRTHLGSPPRLQGRRTLFRR